MSGDEIRSDIRDHTQPFLSDLVPEMAIFGITLIRSLGDLAVCGSRERENAHGFGTSFLGGQLRTKDDRV